MIIIGSAPEFYIKEMNKEKDEDKRIEVDNEDENKYYIYFIDKWMYKYHRTDINNKKI